MTRPRIVDPASVVVVAVGLGLTAAAYVIGAGSLASGPLAAAGLVGCLAAVTSHGWGFTVIGACAVGQLVARPEAGVAAAVLIAVLLAGLLAAAEVVESGRWRAGWRQPARVHLAPVCLGIGGTAATLLVGTAGTESGRSAEAVVAIGVVAAAGALAAIVVRVRERS